MTTSPPEQHNTTANSELSASRSKMKRPTWEVVAKIGAQIPDEEWAKVPSDGSINYKYYLYGSPKKDR